MDKLTIRVPRDLHRAIKKAAAKDARSVNSWCNVTLAFSVDPPKPRKVQLQGKEEPTK